MIITAVFVMRNLSLSARRAWIEIVISAMTGQISVVALRKESVDRNTLPENPMVSINVALRKESVDRNRAYTMTTTICTASLSARRAWIEISIDDLEPSKTRSRSPQGERG